MKNHSSPFGPSLRVARLACACASGLAAVALCLAADDPGEPNPTPPRQGPPNIEPGRPRVQASRRIAMLERERQELELQLRRLKEEGNDEKARDVRGQLEARERELAELRGARGLGGNVVGGARGEGDRPMRRRDMGHLEMAERRRHLEIAAEHLRMAGFPEVAERLREKLEAMRRPMHAGPDRERVLPELEELRREIAELREGLREMRERLEDVARQPH